MIVKNEMTNTITIDTAPDITKIHPNRLFLKVIAKENKNNENIVIKRDGIKVKSEKKIIYFLLAIEPRTLILFFNEFFISIKIIIKKTNSNIPLKIKSIWRLRSFNLTKLLSINVKNVINPIVSVLRNMSVINRFLFKKVNIN